MADLKIWSEDELNKLRSLWGNVGKEELLKHLTKRTWAAIQNKVDDLNLRREDIAAWSDGELTKLIFSWPRYDRTYIQQLFPNRTWSSIKSKACSLGLEKPIKSLTYSDDLSLIDSPLIRSAVIECIRKDGKHINDISKALNLSEEMVLSILTSLSEHGYLIQKRGSFVKLISGIQPDKIIKINPKLCFGQKLEFGVISDTHLGSYNERLDILEIAYNDFASKGIKVVYHVGNIVEGESSFNKYDIRVNGITDQALYCLDHYPQRSGIVTNYITADDHEGWWFQREGLDFGRYLYFEAQERGRKDLIHIGYQEIDIEFKTSRGSSIMRLSHPGKGTSYSDSYQAQKQVESYQGGEKPHILLLGHYHKAGYFFPREIHTILCGCVSDQSRFMRKRNIPAHVGYYIIRFVQNELGVISEFSPTFKHFFDKKYYRKMAK